MKTITVWDNGQEDPPMRVLLTEQGRTKALIAEFKGESGRWRRGDPNSTNDPSAFEILECAFLERHEDLVRLKLEELAPMLKAFEAIESYSENQLITDGRTIIFRGLVIARRLGVGLEIIAEGPQRDGALEVEALWRRYPNASVLNPEPPSR